MTKRCTMTVAGLLLGMGMIQTAQAVEIKVKVQNLSPEGGFYFTPLFAGFHDGSFDYFDAGDTASAATEALAEGGDPSGLAGEIGLIANSVNGVIVAPDGFGGAPIFDPGNDMGMSTFDVDPSDNRYFSYASMIIPSNDAFIGNDDATAYEIFDDIGNFTGVDILVFAGEIWDAGTELNDGQGAAFSALGGTSTDEKEAIALHAGLDNFLNTDTAAGTTITAIPSADTAIARITISQVPEPAIVALFATGLGMMLVTVGRRRRS